MSESTVERTKGPDAESTRRKQWPIALARRAISRHSALYRRIILVRIGRESSWISPLLGRLALFGAGAWVINGSPAEAV